MNSIKHILTALLIAAVAPAASAQNSSNTFSIMSLNVDGLSKKIMFFNVNPDGPGSEGSERISTYIAGKGCDFVAMQECFNYRWEIWSRLFADYTHDEWTGGIDLDETDIDFFHLQNVRFPCDGLNCAWKQNIHSNAYERVAHKQNFGKFSHDFDEMITKGFRRHELTLADGTEIVVYNTHFDASSERDEKLDNDLKDRQARQAQWAQLRDHLMNRLDTRPVIIAGDFNSYYRRDDIQNIFVNAIETTGKATVGDAWVLLNCKGVYPEMGSAANDEMLDKILFINPVDGMKITPVSFEVDSVNYKYEGKPMGDHFPVIAKFSIIEASKETTAIADLNAEGREQQQAYDLRGLPAKNRQGIVIRNGHKELVK